VISNRLASLLVLPAALLFAVLLVAPLAFVLRVSLLPPGPGAPLEGAWTLAAYRALVDPYLLEILVRTVRIAGLTTVCTLVLGFPMALALRRSSGTWRLVQIGLIVTPLFVSVVVRAYGWVLLLGSQGPLVSIWARLGGGPATLLGTETAVVAGLTEGLLPFMVLSLAAVLAQQEPDLEEASRGLGASAFATFCRVTLPLALPGVAAGSLLVFMVAMGSYATPALVGGSRQRLMVTEIYTQTMTVFDWPLAAALSMLLLAAALVVALVATRVLRTAGGAS